MKPSPDSPEHVGIVIIHGVGETEAGWINEYFIPNLEKRHAGLACTAHSEDHRLPDLGRSRPGTRFKACVRRAELDDSRRVTFMELFWADLSRVGQGPFTNFLSMMQLFYEAPLVLGASFLRQKQYGLRALIAAIVRVANWLVRWPITGLNSAAIVTAIGFLGLQKLREVAIVKDYLNFPDIYPVAAMLLLISLATWAFARRNVHKEILLTDIALSTAIFSGILFLLAAGMALYDPGALAGARPFLLFAEKPILWLWYLWNHVVVAGIVLIGLMAIGKIFKPAGQRLATLMRPASALGLTTIQGMIWKIVITLPWWLLIGVLDPGAVGCTEESDTAICDLSIKLLQVFLMNLTLAIVLALGGLILISLRSVLVRLRRKKLLAGKARLPRLIVSPWLIMLMFALTVLNFAVFFPQVYKAAFGIEVPVLLDVQGPLKTLFTSGAMTTFIGTASLLLYLIFFRAVQNASAGVLHIVRDLVDHEYTPEFILSRFMLPQKKGYRGRFPRRERIQRRFDALMEHLDKEHCDRLILVAHSQGSVILHDYMRTGRDDKTLSNARRIDIVTLGSPLSHFYQHYFPGYEAVNSSAERLNPRLASWTNLYRIDDPIGARVRVVSGDFIVNEALPPGGHVDYWKEPRVCDVVLDLIDPTRRTVKDADKAPTATP